MKARSGILEILLILPVIWMIDVLICFVYARHELGYWPSPYRPDPKDVINNLFHVLSVFGVLYTMVLSPVIALTYVILGAMKKIELSNELLAAWSLPILFFIGDRYFNWRIVEWILD